MGNYKRWLSAIGIDTLANISSFRVFRCKLIDGVATLHAKTSMSTRKSAVADCYEPEDGHVVLPEISWESLRTPVLAVVKKPLDLAAIAASKSLCCGKRPRKVGWIILCNYGCASLLNSSAIDGSKCLC